MDRCFEDCPGPGFRCLACSVAPPGFADATRYTFTAAELIARLVCLRAVACPLPFLLDSFFRSPTARPKVGLNLLGPGSWRQST